MINYEVHKKYLTKSKVLVIVIYIFLMPFIETPYWCLDQVDDLPIHEPWIYDCSP